MKVYVAHSSSFDYLNELYLPLRKSELNTKHELFLPHDAGKNVHSKEAIKTSDAVVAEVSYPSTGEGIELGWADSFSIPIYCLHKEGAEPSKSLTAVAKKIVPYSDQADLLVQIEALLVD